MTQHGVFETVRIINGSVPLWPLHVARLARGAESMRYELPRVAEPSGGEDRIVRIELGPAGLSYSERELGSEQPIALLVSPVVHRGYRHKFVDRAWLEAARTTATPFGADDVILCDDAGNLVEATRWAIGWWESETLCFPPLTLGGLASVARTRLGEIARGGIRERAIHGSTLSGRSLLACNAARGIVPVAALDGAPMPANHRTEALAKRFWNRRLA